MPSNIPHLAGDLHIRSFPGQHALRWTFPPCAALGICEKINRDSPGRLPSLSHKGSGQTTRITGRNLKGLFEGRERERENKPC